MDTVEHLTQRQKTLLKKVSPTLTLRSKPRNATCVNFDIVRCSKHDAEHSTEGIRTIFCLPVYLFFIDQVEDIALKATIRIQIFRIAFVFALLTALSVWQSHFIISSIEANPYLNLLIIGVFIFGSVLCLLTVFGLRNDVVAYDALQAIYNDAKQRGFGSMDRDTIRAICLTPGKVFSSSQLLGPVFDLTLDELLRSREMRLSLATMQNLITAIDSRIAHQRSLSNYLTSLCILMGLVGTFIGLMEMVGSVGGIIGGLANSQGNSSDVMRSLIKNLEAPLVGMAQGFSASLFGLFGSLTLGLLGRFTNIATHSIREHFETWLAGISQISRDGAPDNAGSSQGSSANPLLQRLGLTLRSNTERMEQQIEIVERISRQLDRVARAEKQTLEGLSRIDALQNEMARLREDVSHQTSQLRSGMLDAFEQIARGTQEQHAGTLNELSALASGQKQIQNMTAQLATTQGKLGETLELRTASLQTDLTRLADEQALTQTRLSEGLAAQSRNGQLQDEQNAALMGAVERLISAHARTEAILTNLADGQDGVTASLQAQQAAYTTGLERLVAASQRTDAGVGELVEQQAARGREDAARAQLQMAELTRLTSIQEQANALLIRLAAAHAAQPSQATVTAIVNQTVSSSMNDVAQAIERSLQTIGQEIARLSEEQNRTLAAMSGSPEEVFKREMREMSRTLQSGISAGLGEVAQTLEATLSDYTDAMRTLAENSAERTTKRVS